jgi:hypothetical protein
VYVHGAGRVEGAPGVPGQTPGGGEHEGGEDKD